MSEVPKWFADIMSKHYHREAVREFVRSHLEEHGEAAADEEIDEAADELTAALNEQRPANATEFWSAEQLTAIGQALAFAYTKPVKEISAGFRAAFERLRAERKIRVLKCDAEHLLTVLWNVTLGAMPLPDERIVGKGRLNYMPSTLGRMARLLKAEGGHHVDEVAHDAVRGSTATKEDRGGASPSA